MQEARTEKLRLVPGPGNGAHRPPAAVPPGAEELWEGVERLVDRASSLADLGVHGLHLVAARRWRERGRELPDGLQREARATAILGVVAAGLLERVRAVCDGPLLL